MDETGLPEPLGGMSTGPSDGIDTDAPIEADTLTDTDAIGGKVTLGTRPEIPGVD